MEHFLGRRIIDLHQDLPRLLLAIKQGHPIYIYTGRGPSSPRLHLGHLIPFLFTKTIADSLNAPVVIQLSDDEKFAFSRTDTDLEQIQQWSRGNEEDIWRIGFERDRTVMFRNTEIIGKFYKYYLEINKMLSCKMVRQVMGITEDDPVSRLSYPAMQMIPCLPESLHLDPASLCVIPCAVDQYPFFRLARHILLKMGKKPPILLCASTYLPSLKPQYGGKMSSSEPRSAVFLGDTDVEIDKKVRGAVSGGAGTRTEQEEGGAKDLERDFAGRVLWAFETDTSKFERVMREYREGRLLSRDVKSMASQLIIDLFAKLK